MSFVLFANVAQVLGAIVVFAMSVWMLLDARRHRREMAVLREKSDAAHREFLDVSERLKRSLERAGKPDSPKDRPS